MYDHTFQNLKLPDQTTHILEDCQPGDCMSSGFILSSQVVSLPIQSVIQEAANFCAAMNTLTDQDPEVCMGKHTNFYCPKVESQ